MAQDLPQAEKILLYSKKKVRANLTSRSRCVVTVHPFGLWSREKLQGGKGLVIVQIWKLWCAYFNLFINLSAVFFFIII